MAFMSGPVQAGYQQAGGEPSFFSEIGGTALLGGAMQHGAGKFGNWVAKKHGYAGVGYGGFAYTQHSGVLSGGWNNRFALAAKGGMLETFGFEAIEDVAGFNKMAKGFGVEQISGGQKFSFMGAKNAQLRAMRVMQNTPYTGVPKVPRSGFAALKAEGLGLNALGRIAGTAFGAYAIYSGVSRGYQQGGVTGAIAGGAKEAAMWAGMHVGATAFASATGMSVGSVLLPAAIIGGLAYGGYKATEYGRDEYKKIGRTEFVAPLVDPLGTGHTMRQRSLMAMQKSHINGKLAIGNEALLLHSPRLR